MSSHTTLIMFVTMMILTVGGVAVFYEQTQSQQQQAHRIDTQSASDKQGGGQGLELVNTIGTHIDNDTFKYVRLQVKYEGEDRLSLNDTFIQLRTQTSVADLQYRNGTTNRDEANGFYTE